MKGKARDQSVPGVRIAQGAESAFTDAIDKANTAGDVIRNQVPATRIPNVPSGSVSGGGNNGPGNGGENTGSGNGGGNNGRQ